MKWDATMTFWEFASHNMYALTRDILYNLQKGDNGNVANNFWQFYRSNDNTKLCLTNTMPATCDHFSRLLNDWHPFEVPLNK